METMSVVLLVLIILGVIKIGDMLKAGVKWLSGFLLANRERKFAAGKERGK